MRRWTTFGTKRSLRKSREGAIRRQPQFTLRTDPKYLSLLPGLVITFTSYPVPTNGAQQ